MARQLPLALSLLAMLPACSRDAPRTDPPPVASSSASAASVVAAAPASATALPVEVKRRAPSREGGTVALAYAGDALYVADEDHALLHRLAVPLDPTRPKLSLPLPGRPAQVLVLPDRVLVTIRSVDAATPSTEPTASAAPPASSASAPVVAAGAPTAPSSTGPGLLLVLRPDAEKGFVETARVELPQDAWGIAVTPDASLAIVTSAWTHRVSAVDLATFKVRWSLAVAREPRAVVVRADGRGAYVTHLTQAKITRIDDLQAPKRVRSVNLPAAPLRWGDRQGLVGATLAYAAVLSPDGRRLFVPRHAVGVLGRKAWFGASSIDVLLTQDDASLAPPRRDEQVGFVEPPTDQAVDYNNEFSEPIVVPDAAPTPFAQPRAAVYLERRRSLLVLGEGSDTLTEHDALAVDPAMHPLRRYDLSQTPAEGCGAPSGVALSPDERTAWIHCRSTDTLLALELDADEKAPRPLVHLAEAPLSGAAALGRRLYYDGTDRVMSGGLGCAGCHPEGRDDGQLWFETESVPPKQRGHATFVSSPVALTGVSPTFEELTAQHAPPDPTFYARQTPMLAGRVSADGPYGWHGESRTLEDRLRAGFQLHRWDEPPRAEDTRARVEALATFLRRGLVPPPREVRPLTAKEERGRVVFMSDEAMCWTCHKPEREYTDRASYAVIPVLAKGDELADPETKFKTPSLRFVGGTAPYFHDGSAATLADLVQGNGERMGNTSKLSIEEAEALVAFLETL